MTEHLQNPSRGAMLQAVNQTSFAVVEANLYLDTHPCDMEALSYLNQMMEAYKNAKAAYEAQFGPLNAGNVTEMPTGPGSVIPGHGKEGIYNVDL